MFCVQFKLVDSGIAPNILKQLGKLLSKILNHTAIFVLLNIVELWKIK